MRPDDLLVDDGGVRRRGVLYGGIGVVFAVVSTAAALALTDTSARAVLTLGGVMLALSVGWLTAHLLISLARLRRERHELDAFFEGAIWEHWTYLPEDWRIIVDRDHPEDPPIADWDWNDHLVTFGGIGLVLSTIIVLAGVFGFDDPDVTPVVFVLAGSLFAVMIGAAIAQPFYLRRVHHDRRTALLAIDEPGAWFGPHAIYHHELGFVPLEPLAGVHDETAHRHTRPGARRRSVPHHEAEHVLRGDGSIVFTIGRETRRLDDIRPIPARVVHVDVPASARDRSADLVAHYHRGRPELAD